MAYTKDAKAIEFEDIDDDADNAESKFKLTDEQHDTLLKYLLGKLDDALQKRTNRLHRYALMDQTVSTWQKLSPEDSERVTKEELGGRLQAIPMNLPIAQAHIDDSVAFYAEVFAPIGGNFYANPGKRTLGEAMKALIAKMNQDTQVNKYYKNICAAMRALHKYNIGGFTVRWEPGNTGSNAGPDSQVGNRVKAIDMYNAVWDPSLKDISRLHKDGEWFAEFEEINRLTVLRMLQKGDRVNIGRVLEANNKRRAESNTGKGKAKYYKHPPAQTNMEHDGSDSKTTSTARQGVIEVDWETFYPSLNDDTASEINGHEITKMMIWLNPLQFGLGDSTTDTLELWEFEIIDGEWITFGQPMKDAVELPAFLARLNQDDMADAFRSVGEFLIPFQRFISFLLNTHVEGVRSSVWGLKAIDPTMFDDTGLRNGEVAGLLKSKVPGRDVRTGFMQLSTQLDTRQNLADAGTMMDLMKQFFPNQALPAQIAGMDRAVNSQVAAVLQGAMRKLHMLVRLVDSDLMLPVRMAQYRNIALYDPDKATLGGIKEEEVATLLASGLGQIGREAAAESVRSLIFALIQNPEGNEGNDLPGLFTLWSNLMNIGTDLGEYTKQQTPVVPPAGPQTPEAQPPGLPVDPSAGAPVPMI